MPNDIALFALIEYINLTYEASHLQYTANTKTEIKIKANMRMTTNQCYCSGAASIH